MKNINSFSILSFLTLFVLGIAACGSAGQSVAVTADTGENVKITDSTNSAAKEVKTQNKNAAVEKKESQKKVEIYDGRKPMKPAQDASKSDTEQAEKEFKSKEPVVKQKMGDFYCFDEDNKFGLTGMSTGSFTKPNSNQKAFLYELCSSGSSHFGTGGILIMEGDKAVAHIVYGENGLYNGSFSSLPDINQNGLNELMLTVGQTHQGYTGEALTLVEFPEGDLKIIGGAVTMTDNSGAMEDEAEIKAEAYKIWAEPSAKPVFYRDLYEQNGNAKDWKLVKKAEKFTLDNREFGKYHKID